MTLKGQLGKNVDMGSASGMVAAARSLRLVSVGADVGIPRCDGGGGAVDGGVAGISGGTAGSSSGKAGSSVNSSGFSGNRGSDGGAS
jgi:hypothetical protein